MPAGDKDDEDDDSRRAERHLLQLDQVQHFSFFFVVLLLVPCIFAPQPCVDICDFLQVAVATELAMSPLQSMGVRELLTPGNLNAALARRGLPEVTSLTPSVTALIGDPDILITTTPAGSARTSPGYLFPAVISLLLAVLGIVSRQA